MLLSPLLAVVTVFALGSASMVLAQDPPADIAYYLTSCIPGWFPRLTAQPVLVSSFLYLDYAATPCPAAATGNCTNLYLRFHATDASGVQVNGVRIHALIPTNVNLMD